MRNHYFEGFLPPFACILGKSDTNFVKLVLCKFKECSVTWKSKKLERFFLEYHLTLKNLIMEHIFSHIIILVYFVSTHIQLYNSFDDGRASI